MATSLPLHQLRSNEISTTPKPRLWPIHHVSSEADEAHEKECALPSDVLLSERSGVCCKTLKGTNDRSIISKEVASDLIIGLSDGLTVPFALTAGLSSLGNSHLVVTAGLAELIAGAISMGLGGFLATQSEQQHFLHIARQTQDRVRRSCSSQMEAEVTEILSPFGLDERTCRIVANQLLRLEIGKIPAQLPARKQPFWHRLARQPITTARPTVTEAGLTPFLLKHGEGIENTSTRRLVISAFTVGLGYFAGGICPLLPYFFIPTATDALHWSILVSGIVLLLFGAVKTRYTSGSVDFFTIAYGAFTMLAIGGVASSAAYGLVKALEGSHTATVD